MVNQRKTLDENIMSTFRWLFHSKVLNCCICNISFKVNKETISKLSFKLWFGRGRGKRKDR
jgi:hypothetical protein